MVSTVLKTRIDKLMLDHWDDLRRLWFRVEHEPGHSGNVKRIIYLHVVKRRLLSSLNVCLIDSENHNLYFLFRTLVNDARILTLKNCLNVSFGECRSTISLSEFKFLCKKSRFLSASKYSCLDAFSGPKISRSGRLGNRLRYIRLMRQNA
jgi:hypothetical protein